MTEESALPAIDIATLLLIPTIEAIPLPATLEVLATAPFLPIPGALNLRTLSSPPTLAPNRIFRSGFLSQLPLSSLSRLHTDYNIRTIFDLRSAAERLIRPSPDVPGVDTVWVASESDVEREMLSSEEFEKREKDRTARFVTPKDFVDEQGLHGTVKLYRNVLDMHKDPYRAVFERLKDREEGGVLFHCTAGKDRTGVLSALILALVNAPEEAISQDYALTRIGVEPFREVLLKQLLSQMPSGTISQSPEENLAIPGFLEMCGTRGKNMLGLLEAMDGWWGCDVDGAEVKYRGVVGYLKSELGFSDDDLSLIRQNLRVKDE